MRKDRDALQDQANKLQKRVSLLQRKYAEEKARASGLVRTKHALEGKTRKLQTEVERLEQEKATALSEHQALLATLKKKSGSLEARIARLSEEHLKLKAERDTLEHKYKNTVKELDGKLAQLAAEKQALESEAKRQAQLIKRCQSHNARLCIIANELVQQYEGKGVMSSILHKEPLTQLKKVALEQFVQEYQERIDAEKLKTSEVTVPIPENE